MAGVSVVIADDELLIREALRAVFEAEGDFTVVGAAATVDEAVALIEHHRPEVAVVDVRMPAGGGAEVARRVAGLGTRLVAFSAYDDAGHRRRMREAGVGEYVLKGMPNAEIVAAVRRAVAAGRLS
ncbi:response regulator [Amycolatopsis albispora]|uniref:response regulator n=1 Tax=Amycolatopsis albispora TaxID=1804986 RepID=UPI001F2FE6FD|nr:response regulator transcription factor [Amycolatopsis albispora]